MSTDAPASPNTVDWFVYLMRCADGTLYAGVTTDLQRRLHEHNHCNRRGARYTRARRPVTLVYNEQVADRATACRREYALRQLTKREKNQLIATCAKP